MSHGPDVDHDALVVRVLGGDAAALHELVRDLVPRVRRICRARIGHLPDAAAAIDDVAQDVLVAVVGALPRYRIGGPVPFVGFVHGVARHKAADTYRAAARNRSTPEPVPQDRPDPAAGPEEVVLRAETAAEVGLLLDRLSPRLREVLILRIVEGMSARDVGAVLGMTEGAVRVAQHRALVALRRFVASRV